MMKPTTDYLITPPHNIEAEEAVLGSVLIDPAAFDSLLSTLKPNDFYIVRHGWVWEAFRTLTASGAAIDLLTVGEELERKEQLKEAGGPAFLTRLVTLTPSAFNVESYAKMVAEASERRRIIIAASEAAKLAFDRSFSIEEVREAVSQHIDTALNAGVRKGQIVSIGDALSQQYEAIQKNQKSVAQGHGVVTPTGWTDVDRYLKGWYPGASTLIMGEARRGKSAAILRSLWLAASEYGRKVLYITREMTPMDTAARHLQQELGITWSQQVDGELLAEEWAALTEEIHKAKDAPFWIDSHTHTVPGLRSVASRFARDGGYLLAIDYLQLITPENVRASRSEQVAGISRMMKAISIDHYLSVVCISSINRDRRTRSGTALRLTDARDSGDLEHDFDNVIAIHPTEESEDTDTDNCAQCGHARAIHEDKTGCRAEGCSCKGLIPYTFQIIKNRRGHSNISVSLLFDPARLVFLNASKDDPR